MGAHRIALAAAFAAAALTSTATSAQDRNLGRNLAAQCANCHGTNGRSQGGMPALAGRGKDELVRIMGEFKSGARTGPQSTIMHQLAKGYSDDQIALIADYLSRQKPAQ
jgi:cytochrome c553